MSAELLVRAKAGDGEARMELARAASRAGKRAEADHWIAEAAATGLPAAQFQTGIWKLIGHRGARDVDGGLAIIRAAAAAGEAQANTMLSALAVAPTAPARDWSAAARLLCDAAAGHDPRALLQLALLLPADRKWRETRISLADRAAGKGNPPALYFAGRWLLEDGGQESQALARLALAANNGEPNALKLLRGRRAPAAETASPVFELTDLNWSRIASTLQWPHERPLPQPVARNAAPRVVTLNRLLSADECDYVVSRGAPFLKPAPGLASSAMPFGPIETDTLIESLDERLCRALGTDARHAEPLAMLHDRPGQAGALLTDWIDPAQPGGAAEIAARGQRKRSLMLALNDGYDGGETAFPRLGWRFKGKRGDALIWSSTTDDGALDPKAVYEMTPPRLTDRLVLVKRLRDRDQTEGRP